MTTHRGRRAVQLENQHLRVTVLHEGGHIAELLDKRTGLNPLWTPPWPSIEPSTYDPQHHPEYGHGTESRLLAGIMGHNLCLDLFGGPSPEEAAAGLTVHGEASVLPYDLVQEGTQLHARLVLPLAQLRLTRTLDLAPDQPMVRVTETVENLVAWDRPLAWTQHVTLGPPFLEPGATAFRCPGTRSLVYPEDFTGGQGYQQTGAEFDWPHVPCLDGRTRDLRRLNDAPRSAGFTTHQMDPAQEHAYFLAHAPTADLTCGYVWRRADFPWLGIWEENHSRTQPPWNGQTLALGMEFGTSPLPESRRRMVERASLFGTPTYRWLPARGTLSVTYAAFLQHAPTVPTAVTWDGELGLYATMG